MYSSQTMRVLSGVLFALAISMNTGCGGSNGAVSTGGAVHPAAQRSEKPGTSAVHAPSNVSTASASAVHANELGRILVLEYHNIRDNPKDVYSQSPAQLRSDLQLLYDNGYSTLDIHDFLNGRIDTPAGKTPVVITFDDASKYQFRYLDTAGTRLDPDCAVAILNTFAASHAGFGNHATFFVLPSGFEQPALKAKKYQYLITHGYAVGNHTWTHPKMQRLTPEKVQEEIGRDDADIAKILPEYKVDILAYPFGTRPRTAGKTDYTYIAHGSWQGRPYHISAAFLVGAEPSPSPYSVKFKPLAIPRVQAIEKDFPNAEKLSQWVQAQREHPGSRFISDGDPDVISFPAKLKLSLNSSAAAGRKIVTW